MTYEPSKGSLSDIWEIISDNKTVVMSFSSKTEANSFRTNLSHLKRRKEKRLIDIGFMHSSEIQSLSMVPMEGTLGFTYKLSLAERVYKQREYTILSTG